MPEKPKLLLTGSPGIFGRAFVKKFSSSYQITGISKSSREGSVACDLSSEAAVLDLFSQNSFDAVVNAAAFSDVDACEKDPLLAYLCNTKSVVNLAQICGSKQIPLLHISTDYVFDGMKRTPYLETDKTFPVNVYGMTKLAGEHHALKCSAPSAVVRTSWLFGDGNPKNFVTAVLGKMKSSKAVSILDDQIDSPTYANDLAEAASKILANLFGEKNKSAATHKIYQVCNQGEATRHQMACEMNQILKLGVTVSKTDRAKIQGRLAVRPAYGSMNPRLFESEFGTVMRPWQTALKEYLLGVSK